MNDGIKQDETLPAGKETAETSAVETPESAVAELMGVVEESLKKSEVSGEKSEEETVESDKAEETAEDETAEVAEEAEAAEETEDKLEDDDQIRAGEIKGLPEDVQAKVNRKIAKKTAKQRQAEEKAEAATTENAALKARVAELEAKTDGEFAQNLSKLDLPAELLSKDEAKLLADVDGLHAAEEFALGDNEDGTSRWTDGHKATHRDGDDTDFSAAAVRKRFADVRRRLDEMGPKASVLRADRSKKLKEALAIGLSVLSGKAKLAGAEKAEKTDGKDAPKKVIKPPPVPGISSPKKAPVKSAKAGLTAQEVMDAPDTTDGLATLLAKHMR